MEVKVTQSYLTLRNPMDYTVLGIPGIPGLKTGMNTLSFLQWIFPTQGLSPGLLHCRWIIYQLSHKGSPRILEPIPSPADLPNPGIRSGSPALQVHSLPTELSGKPNTIIRQSWIPKLTSLAETLQSRKAYIQSKVLFLLEQITPFLWRTWFTR